MKDKAVKLKENTINYLDSLRKKYPYLKTYDSTVQFLIVKKCEK